MEVVILSNASRPATITDPRASAMPQASAEGDQDADVIVVGAGPGGSAAATFLSRQGLDVLLLEKSQFPREKVCGDGGVHPARQAHNDALFFHRRAIIGVRASARAQAR